MGGTHTVRGQSEDGDGRIVLKDQTMMIGASFGPIGLGKSAQSQLLGKK